MCFHFIYDPHKHFLNCFIYAITHQLNVSMYLLLFVIDWLNFKHTEVCLTLFTSNNFSIFKLFADDPYDGEKTQYNQITANVNE